MSDPEDIVTRLRNWAPCWALHDQISIDLNQGADKIERLRADLSIFHGVSHELDRIRGQLREAAETLERLYTENEQLTDERDEARREICERVSTTIWKPQFPLMSKTQYAEERGWDCFKEDG